MSTCGYDGTAIVARVNDEPAWQRTDDRTHVTAELCNDPNARSFIEGKYVIGEWCNEEHAYHARLKPKETA